MTGMRTVVCWGPECAEPVTQRPKGRPTRYHSVACKQRAFRRNGNKAPDAPMPPLEPSQVLPSKPPEMRGPAATPPAPARKAKPPKARRPKPEVPVLPPPPPPPAPAKVTQLHIAVTEDATVPVVLTVNPMVAAYKADLERMGQATSRQGLQVIEMAEKLVSSATSPAAAANLSKELERLMAGLEEATPVALADRDPSQMIRERTLEKLRAVAG